METSSSPIPFCSSQIAIRPGQASVTAPFLNTVCFPQDLHSKKSTSNSPAHFPQGSASLTNWGPSWAEPQLKPTPSPRTFFFLGPGDTPFPTKHMWNTSSYLKGFSTNTHSLINVIARLSKVLLQSAGALLKSHPFPCRAHLNP